MKGHLIGTPKGAPKGAPKGLVSVGGKGIERLSLNSRLVFEGDSITAGSSGPAYSQFAMMLSGGRYYCPYGYNNAVGGQTAAQMAIQVATVTALEPDVVVFLAGTNDLSGTEDTVDQIFANIRTCVEAYLAAGARVIQIAVLPRNDDTWLGLDREADRLALNAKIIAQDDVTVISAESSFDPTTMTEDGLHPNYKGAWVIGTKVAQTLLRNISADSIIDYGIESGTNLLVDANENPELTGTTGTKGTNTTGEVASKWSISNNGDVAVVASKTMLNGREAQKIIVSGNQSVAGRVVTITNTVAYNGQAGECYQVWWDFRLESNHQGLRAVSSSCDTTAMPNASKTSILNNDTLEGVLRAPNTSQLGAADVSTSVQAFLSFDAGEVYAEFIVAAPYFGLAPAV